MADKKISQLDNATTPLDGTETLPIVQGSATKKVTVDNLTAGKTVTATSLGLGVTTPLRALHISSTSGAYALLHKSATSTAALLVGAENARNTIYSWTTPSGSTGVPLTFFIGATETARFDSAGDLTLQAGNLKLATAGKGIDFSANTNAAGMTSELLSRYEEGTFTPVIADADTGGNTATGTFTGRYTRIGRIVHVTISLESIDTTGLTASAAIRVRGLPYVAVTFNQYACSIATANFSISTGAVTGSILGGYAGLYIIRSTNGGSQVNAIVSDIKTSCYIYINATYQA